MFWPKGGLQAAEVMLYTIDKVNEMGIMPSGVTLGTHILDDCDKDTYGLQQAVDFIKGTLHILIQVYDRNNYFSLGLIPKPKLKMADTFGPKPHFKRRNLVTDSMGYYFHHKKDSKIKFAAKYEIFLDYYCRSMFNFKLFKFYIPQEVGKHEKTERKKNGRKRGENSKKSYQ